MRPTTTDTDTVIPSDAGFGPWRVRLVREGDAYGQRDCLTHGEAEPLVELYAAAADPEKFGPRGQFVSRYYLSSFVGFDRHSTGERFSGINLDGGVPAWTLTRRQHTAAVAAVALLLAGVDPANQSRWV
jgi:hypothetical protein